MEKGQPLPRSPAPPLRQSPSTRPPSVPSSPPSPDGILSYSTPSQPQSSSTTSHDPTSPTRLRPSNFISNGCSSHLTSPPSASSSPSHSSVAVDLARLNLVQPLALSSPPRAPPPLSQVVSSSNSNFSVSSPGSRSAISSTSASASSDGVNGASSRSSSSSQGYEIVLGMSFAVAVGLLSVTYEQHDDNPVPTTIFSSHPNLFHTFVIINTLTFTSAITGMVLHAHGMHPKIHEYLPLFALATLMVNFAILTSVLLSDSLKFIPYMLFSLVFLVLLYKVISKVWKWYNGQSTAVANDSNEFADTVPV